jgi:hypothetical protein
MESSARPWWFILASAIGLGLSIAYWYPRLPPEKRQGWLKIVFWSFFGIVIPGTVLIAIIAIVRAFLHK